MMTDDSISLREYFESRLEESRMALVQAREATQRAIDKAEEAAARALVVAQAELEHHIASETLRLETAVNGRTEYVDLRFIESQRAIDKAEAAMNTRLASMNEFRAQLRDQASQFAYRSDFETLRASTSELLKKEVFDTSMAAASKDRDEMKDLVHRNTQNLISVEAFATIQRLVYMALGMAVLMPVLIGIAVAATAGR